ncbi:MAG: response regulator [Deltaproteobacteria bacterium]|nr:response regulator [Deltaproteobacteria bacterium]
MARTILIVDDSASMRDLLRHTLTQSGFDVIEAENGSEALARLQRSRCDLVITDLNMPLMDGLSLIKAVRALAAYKTTPLLLLTTETAEAKKAAARAAGASGWIVKPFDPTSLMKTVGKVLP